MTIERIDTSGLMIWTIGQSTREMADFMGLLEQNEITAIADVRSLPGSSKFPQFNSETLETALAEAGIAYCLVKQLGGRRSARPDSPHTVWRNKSFHGYANHMETLEFREGIEILTDRAGRQRTAVMCAEAVWWRCHRSMIADYLKAGGSVVEHIMEGKNVVHPYTSAVKIVNGNLSYAAG